MNYAVFNLQLDAWKGEVERAIRKLLEERHLYQGCFVDGQAADQGLIAKGHSRQDLVPFLEFWPWIMDSSDSISSFVGVFQKGDAPKIKFNAPDIKVHCARCKRDEPFNPARVWTLDAGQDCEAVRLRMSKQHQAFCLSYVCQSCKGIPEFFMIRRVGAKISLVGRSPMEAVVVPPVIPKSVSDHFSDAVIAYQSGQTLAALFMLRTLIEQYVRPLREGDEKVDQVLARYLDSLPNDFKDRFPSLPSIYSELSAAIHDANDDEDLYESSKERLVEHFDARRLYRLPELPC